MLTVAVLFMYGIITVIVTHPLVWNLDHFVTNPIDPLFYVWNLNQNFHAIVHLSVSQFLDTNMFYPATNTISYSDHLLAQSFLLFPFYFIIHNPLIIQNLYILSTFVLAAFGMYLLAEYLTNNKYISFLSGLLYSFSLYHIDHLGQVPTSSIQWIPFTFLYLFKYVKTGKTKDGIGFWIFYTINFLSTLYYGIFVTIGVGLFWLFHLDQYKKIVRFILLSIPFLILIAISSYPYVLFRLENPDFRRTIDESAGRSAHLIDYFRSAPLVHDRALYPGLVVLAFAVLSLLQIRKNKLIAFLWALVATSMVLSLGPYWNHLRLPYYYLYKITPLFEAIRVPSRMGIITILALCLLATLGAKNLFGTINNVYIRRAIVSLTIIVCVFEFSHHTISFASIPSLSSPPPVYAWLSKQKEKSIILELPLQSGQHSNPIEQQVYKSYEQITKDDNFVAETFRLYFSTIHGKRMVNGYSSYFPPEYSEAARTMETFPSEESVALIINRNVTCIIIHKTQYGNAFTQIQERLKKYEKIEFVRQFGDDLLYQVRRE